MPLDCRSIHSPAERRVSGSDRVDERHRPGKVGERTIKAGHWSCCDPDDLGIAQRCDVHMDAWTDTAAAGSLSGQMDPLDSSVGHGERVQQSC